ncbi:hypothetical protein HDU67_010126 [Dinochytrium kinnereticum]|nr:hypothetical protein HDU67_010126 [Dinochytrium kinnereticum]
MRVSSFRSAVVCLLVGLAPSYNIRVSDNDESTAAPLAAPGSSSSEAHPGVVATMRRQVGKPRRKQGLSPALVVGRPWPQAQFVTDLGLLGHADACPFDHHELASTQRSLRAQRPRVWASLREPLPFSRHSAWAFPLKGLLTMAESESSSDSQTQFADTNHHEQQQELSLQDAVTLGQQQSSAVSPCVVLGSEALLQERPPSPDSLTVFDTSRVASHGGSASLSNNSGTLGDDQIALPLSPLLSEADLYEEAGSQILSPCPHTITMLDLTPPAIGTWVLKTARGSTIASLKSDCGNEIESRCQPSSPQEEPASRSSKAFSTDGSIPSPRIVTIRNLGIPERGKAVSTMLRGPGVLSMRSEASHESFTTCPSFLGIPSNERPSILQEEAPSPESIASPRPRTMSFRTLGSPPIRSIKTLNIPMPREAAVGGHSNILPHDQLEVSDALKAVEDLIAQREHEKRASKASSRMESHKRQSGAFAHISVSNWFPRSVDSSVGATGPLEATSRQESDLFPIQRASSFASKLAKGGSSSLGDSDVSKFPGPQVAKMRTLDLPQVRSISTHGSQGSVAESIIRNAAEKGIRDRPVWASRSLISVSSAPAWLQESGKMFNQAPTRVGDRSWTVLQTNLQPESPPVPSQSLRLAVAGDLSNSPVISKSHSRAKSETLKSGSIHRKKSASSFFVTPPTSPSTPRRSNTLKQKCRSVFSSKSRETSARPAFDGPQKEDLGLNLCSDEGLKTRLEGVDRRKRLYVWLGIIAALILIGVIVAIAFLLLNFGKSHDSNPRFGGINSTAEEPSSHGDGNSGTTNNPVLVVFPPSYSSEGPYGRRIAFVDGINTGSFEVNRTIPFAEASSSAVVGGAFKPTLRMISAIPDTNAVVMVQSAYMPNGTEAEFIALTESMEYDFKSGSLRKFDVDHRSYFGAGVTMSDGSLYLQGAAPSVIGRSVNSTGHISDLEWKHFDSQRSPMALRIPREHPAAVPLLDGYLLFVGGLGDNSSMERTFASGWMETVPRPVVQRDTVNHSAGRNIPLRRQLEAENITHSTVVVATHHIPPPLVFILPSGEIYIGNSDAQGSTGVLGGIGKTEDSSTSIEVHPEVSTSMSAPRSLGSTVQLPDGSVLAVGGLSPQYIGSAGMEVFLPNTGAFKSIQSGTWHPAGIPHLDTMRDFDAAGAVLLPDARVMILGTGLDSNITQSQKTSVGYFSPHYLTSGKPRPNIESLDSKDWTYGQEIHVRISMPKGWSHSIPTSRMPSTRAADLRSVMLSGNDSGPKLEFSLVHTGVASSLSGQNSGQRMVWLSSKASVMDGSVGVMAPPTAGVAPPGKYMLFALMDGIPSAGAWVRLGDSSKSFMPA